MGVRRIDHAESQGIEAELAASPFGIGGDGDDHIVVAQAHSWWNRQARGPILLRGAGFIDIAVQQHLALVTFGLVEVHAQRVAAVRRVRVDPIGDVELTAVDAEGADLGVILLQVGANVRVARIVQRASNGGTPACSRAGKIEADALIAEHAVADKFDKGADGAIRQNHCRSQRQARGGLP
ncbi:MAG: hypothetical protein BWZ07_02629 [Alphaproteobacteria bacterium ADurb.BinA280]|nr:MAG: hypothetical protein BWZ07_02629 [Alphaproteobacteria bacterium ADurb.BinA280]